MKDRGGRINRTPRPDSSATPESEPEEAAVVAAAGDDEQPRPAPGVVETGAPAR